MRVIKFRGKRVGNGKWAYGDLVHSFDTTYIGDEYHFLKEGIVDPATVGQFTGLLDSSEREIYEGDIVSGLDSKLSMIKAWGADIEVGSCNYVVTWHEGKYHLRRPGGELGWIINWHISSKVKELSVVGNVYDNPEFMEGAEQ